MIEIAFHLPSFLAGFITGVAVLFLIAAIASH